MAAPIDLDYVLDFSNVPAAGQIQMVIGHLDGLLAVARMFFPHIPLSYRWEMPLIDPQNFDWPLLFIDVPRSANMLSCRWVEATHRLAKRLVNPGVIAPTADICPGVVFCSTLQHEAFRSILGRLFITRVRLRKSKNQLNGCLLRIRQPSLHFQVLRHGIVGPLDTQRNLKLQNMSALLQEVRDELTVIEEVLAFHLDRVLELPGV